MQTSVIKECTETTFKSQLDELAENYNNFKLKYILSREDSGDSNRNGRIDKDKLNHFYTSELEGLSIEGIYACGPESMIEEVKEFYISKDLLDKVHFELFTAGKIKDINPIEDIDDSISVDSEVTVIIDDEEYVFPLNTDGKDVLSAAQDVDADVPFSCKGGVCCTCRAKVLEGQVKMKLNFSLEEEEVAEGFVLTCQAHPITEKVVISFDEY